MPGIDESKQFVPLKIAVLTVSDTPQSQGRQIRRAAGAAHRRRRPLRRRAQHRARRHRGDPRPRQSLDRRPGDRRDHHHRRHRLHRPRRHAGSGRAAVREEDGRLLGAVPGGELSQDRHVGDPVARHRGRRRRRPTSSACRARPAPARTPGTKFWCTSSITATGRATSSRSCRGSTSICARPKGADGADQA